MTFWGCSLKPGQTHKLGPLPDAEILHLSQVCLHEPKPGKNYVRVQVDSNTFTIACLERDKQEHDAVDLFFGPGNTTFSNKGTSEVHLLGYVEPKDDEEEGAEAKPPALKAKASPKLALAAAVVQASARTSPATKPAASPVATKVASPAMSPKAHPNVKNSPALIPEPKAAVTKSSPKAKAAEEESSDDDMEGEEGEEEEPREDDAELHGLEGEEGEEGEEEETAEEDEEEPEVPAKGKSSAKVPAESPKRKAGEPVAASSPAKKPKASEAIERTPQDIWAEKLVTYLLEHGKTSVAQLGSKVQKPDIKMKLSALLKEFPDKFKVDGDMVNVKK